VGKTIFKVDKDQLQVRMERVYNASPERLYKAYTTAEDIMKWWGPRDYIKVIDKLDVRVGGAWRIVHTDSTGAEYAFNGVYKELDEPNKISQTFEWEGMPGHILVETSTFEDLGDGTTKVSTVSQYDNIEDLEGMVATGMETGAVEGTEQLAELVESNS
jgi:uncharacterized protein YndB with AHSA1/START domain